MSPRALSIVTLYYGSQTMSPRCRDVSLGVVARYHGYEGLPLCGQNTQAMPPSCVSMHIIFRFMLKAMRMKEKELLRTCIFYIIYNKYEINIANYF